jgi:hypothetical protein
MLEFFFSILQLVAATMIANKVAGGFVVGIVALGS